MGLAKAISQAKAHELADLAAYVAGEIEMEGVEVGEIEHRDIEPDSVKAAIMAWAYMQSNQRDGDI